MSFEEALVTTTMEADNGTQVGGRQYRFVYQTGARRCGIGATGPVAGVVQNVVAHDNEATTVAVGGISMVYTGATLAGGDRVMPDGNGAAVLFAPTPVAASLVTGGTEAANNLFRVTADDPGAAGNGITVHLRDPGAASQALAVVVNGNDIVVNLATDAGSVVTSTAAQVRTALDASAAAAALISTALEGTSTGAGVVVAEASPENLTGGADPSEVDYGVVNRGAASGGIAAIRLRNLQ